MASVRPLQSRDELNFIRRLVPDPAHPPRLETVTGFVGQSSESGHTRVYFDLRLSDYIDIPDRAIRLIQRMPETVSPLGASYVWFERAAEVVHGPAGGERRQARFLEGRIAGSAAPIYLENPNQTHDTSPACCMPKPPKPGPPRPGPKPDGDTTDTGSACCGPNQTHDTGSACCQPKPKPKPKPKRGSY